MGRRCWGRTKNLGRCKRTADAWFCNQHRLQLLGLMVAGIFGCIALGANLSSSLELFEKLFNKPIADISIGRLDSTTLQKTLIIPLQVPSDGHVDLDFVVKNIGDAPILKPVVIIRSDPPSVYLRRINGGYDPSARNVVQFAGVNLRDILPFDSSKIKHRFSIQAKAPRDVSEMSLNFQLFGDNLPNQKLVTKFSLTHDGDVP